MSIRLRLTLQYSIILALTLILFSGVLYTIQARQTLAIVKNDLQGAAKGMARTLVGMARLADRRTAPWTSDTSGDETPAVPPQPMGGYVPRRDVMSLLAADGSPIALSAGAEVESLPLSAKGLALLQSGRPWTEIAPGTEGQILIYNEPIMVNGELAGIVQVARSLADRDRALQSLGMVLILGSLLMTGAAFGIGWTLAGITMRPIHRITRAAQEIGLTRDFSSRVPYDGPNDELGQLATTFNNMLSHLEDAFQQVAHALDVQRDFVADVSHELRTPLTTIRGNLALLQHEPPLPGSEQADVVNDLSGESDRLIRLVGDLLTLARADAGRKLASEPIDVGALVEEVCRQARVIEPDREIACLDGHGLVVEGDPDALKQVLLILVDNAVKHGEGTIKVVVREVDRQVAIDVRDSGPGMPPALCARIFDRFYRGDSSRSTPGFGLGLSIAKELVEAQGGSIGVESVEGQGSTFTLLLHPASR